MANPVGCSVVTRDFHERMRHQWLQNYLSKTANIASNSKIIGLLTSLTGRFESPDFRDASFFKSLGIIHLVVISGLHLAILANLLGQLLNLPARACYVLGFVTSRQVAGWDALVLGFTFTLLMGFSWLINFPPPCQRALLFLFWGKVFSTLLQIRLSSLDRFVCAAACQVFLFPESFLSLSNFLSWGIVLVIVSQSRKRALARIAYSQLHISIFLILLFDKVTVVGAFVNILAAPLFPALITTLFICGFGIVVGADVSFIVQSLESVTRALDWLHSKFGSPHFELVRHKFWLATLFVLVIIRDLIKVLRLNHPQGRG